MIITVTRADSAGVDGREEHHEADWVDHGTSNGELTVTCREQASGTVLKWTTYAAGTWTKVGLTEQPSPEVVQYAQRLAERMRATGNGGGFSGAPIGNSGPH